jgi:hypothetical protein
MGLVLMSKAPASANSRPARLSAPTICDGGPCAAMPGRAGVTMTREEFRKWGKRERKLDAADEWLAKHDKGKP